MFSPYPKIEVPADTLIGQAVALKGLLAEVSDSACGEEGCHCGSARKIGHATRVLAELEAIIDAAEARQSLERYMSKYEEFIR